MCVGFSIVNSKAEKSKLCSKLGAAVSDLDECFSDETMHTFVKKNRRDSM